MVNRQNKSAASSMEPYQREAETCWGCRSQVSASQTYGAYRGDPGNGLTVFGDYNPLLGQILQQREVKERYRPCASGGVRQAHRKSRGQDTD